MELTLGTIQPVSPDVAARNTVLAALRDRTVRRMGFGVGGILISPSDYEGVAKAIESSKIRVMVDSSPDASDHLAYYASNSNCFILPPSGDCDPSLVIHEATHAIFDIRKINCSTGESEGMAYIAQALFTRIKNGPQKRYIPAMDENPFSPFSWIGWQMIFDESSALAEILIKTPYITRDRAERLFNAIRMTKKYTDQGARTNNDGV